VTAVPAALDREEISDFQSFGIRAFTTTRSAGTFGLAGPDPVGEVMSRWTDLQSELSQNARKVVIGRQVHGTRVLAHSGGWEGLLRTGEADGHISTEKGIALAVSIADCVPVFIAHESGCCSDSSCGVAWYGRTNNRHRTRGVCAAAKLRRTS
jgi:copper oxidase (laccase) domain-containing protein